MIIEQVQDDKVVEPQEMDELKEELSLLNTEEAIVSMHATFNSPLTNTM
jgi:hypothetical protein